jgi:hypothetical protein
MNVVAIPFANEKSPVEIQAWFDANPTAEIFQIVFAHDIFYVFYS